MGKIDFTKTGLISVEAMLFHPAISNAWLCEQLFGKKDSPTTSIFSNKKCGARNQFFTPEELAKLEEIRLQLIGSKPKPKNRKPR